MVASLLSPVPTTVGKLRHAYISPRDDCASRGEQQDPTYIASLRALYSPPEDGAQSLPAIRVVGADGSVPSKGEDDAWVDGLVEPVRTNRGKLCPHA